MVGFLGLTPGQLTVFAIVEMYEETSNAVIGCSNSRFEGGISPSRPTGIGPRPAIRVEWGTMAFGQSGVSGLNDVALMQISESRYVLLLPLQSHPHDVKTESTRNAVLFGLHPPFRRTDP
jgi:hypothetical protein